MNDIITINNMDSLPREAQAQILHSEILKNGVDAAEAMCSLAVNLKRMRDERYYSELGYDTFEEYTEKAVGLKKSQAYDYIKALESLGEDVFRSSGKLGISKVKVLCAFTPEQAENFVNENDVENMTVKELKAQVEELTKNGEQLTLELENAQNQTTDSEKEITALKEKLQGLENYTEDLEKSYNEIKNKPVEVAVREPSEDEINELTDSAVKKATKELKKQLADAKKEKSESDKKHAEELKRVKEETEKTAREQAKNENAELSGEIDRIKQRSAELEKKLKLSASPEITRFSFFFEAIQGNFQNLLLSLSKIEDTATAEKLRGNLKKYIDMIGEKI